MPVGPRVGASQRGVTLSAAAGAVLGVVATFACGPPPIGWQGAGRLQTLPAPESDSGAPPIDAGIDGENDGDNDASDDAAAPGPDPSPPVLGGDGGDRDAGDAG